MLLVDNAVEGGGARRPPERSYFLNEDLKLKTFGFRFLHKGFGIRGDGNPADDVIQSAIGVRDASRRDPDPDLDNETRTDRMRPDLVPSGPHIPTQGTGEDRDDVT
ncbi:hypothetical protein EYF80_063025 [Liparis tanakae]|uniref:Uncharacterized protein n=1 Tax=Liparis tanakae TaxID=230148 RepID=A0A4Z2EDL9_9TELE|nr:hypothetical protein EYF80_063025 [Liparis tanakae]